MWPSGRLAAALPHWLRSDDAKGKGPAVPVPNSDLWAVANTNYVRSDGRHSGLSVAFGYRKRRQSSHAYPPCAGLPSLASREVLDDSPRTPHCAEEAQWVPSQAIVLPHQPSNVALRASEMRQWLSHPLTCIDALVSIDGD